MNFLDLRKVQNRLQTMEININYAVAYLKEAELVKAQELQAEVNDMLDMNVNVANIKTMVDFIENNDAKISHLNEEALLLEANGFTLLTEFSR